MKEYKVVFSERATERLEDIYDYVCAASLTRWVARQVITEIEQKVRSLNTFPKRDEIYKVINGYEYRFTHAGKYRIVYRVSDEDGIVYITSIMHVKQNLTEDDF